MRIGAASAALFFVLLGGLVSAAPVNDAALMNPKPARHISDYNLFVDGNALTPNERLVPYGLAVPLFTDYAHKYRFIYIPAGKAATYDANEVFDFPVGTTLVKTFAYPADFSKPDENIRVLETRLLIRQEKGWNAWAYVWNDDGTDADLKVAGALIPLSWVDERGRARQTDYLVPNKNQCKGCHSFDKEFSPIGPKARNLNYSFDYPDGAHNQIAYLRDIGYLKGAPTPENAPVVPRADDAAADIGIRARAYLDVNCAHCHRLEGPASTSGLFLTYGEANPTTWGYEKRPVAAGRGSGGLTYDIVPGDPDSSILMYRIGSTDPGVMMPEVGRTMVHEEGMALLREWIKSLR